MMWGLVINSCNVTPDTVPPLVSISLWGRYDLCCQSAIIKADKQDRDYDKQEDLMVPTEYTLRYCLSVCLCAWSANRKSKCFGCSVFTCVGQCDFKLSVSKADSQSVYWPVRQPSPSRAWADWQSENSASHSANVQHQTAGASHWASTVSSLRAE